MSADNTVVILAASVSTPSISGVGQTVSREYRVAHVRAFDNFEWYQNNQLYNLGWYLTQMFGRSPVYKTIEEANERAKAIQEQIGYIEYGIVVKYTDLYYPNSR